MTLPFENRKINLWALPSVFVFSWAAGHLWFFDALMWFTSVIPFHEMGHAYTAWLGGRFALPVGAIIPSAALTFIGQERSVFVTLVFWTLLTTISYRAYWQKLYFIFASSLVLLLTSVVMVFAMSNVELGVWISFGGIAGEFWLSAFVIVAFYFPSFERLRWDFFRFPALGIAGFCFVHAETQWTKIKAGLALMPSGSAMSSEGLSDKHGDINRLIDAGWTREQIVHSYLLIGKACLAIIIVVYFWQLHISSEESKTQEQSS